MKAVPVVKRIVPRPASRIGARTAWTAGAGAKMLTSTVPRRSSAVVPRIGFMTSRWGSGEYSRTSTGPSRSASVSIAAVRPAWSRMSAAAAEAVIPSPVSSATSPSSFSWLRETSPTAKPSRPKRRAIARPRLGPAPMITIDMLGSRSLVLLVGDVATPGDGAAALVALLHGNVEHEAVRRGAVPVVLARLEEDTVARADLFDRAALALAAADAFGDEDRLAVRVRVPGGAGTGCEVHRGGGEGGRAGGRGDGVDVDVAGEPVAGPLLGVDAAAGDLHG